MYEHDNENSTYYSHEVGIIYIIPHWRPTKKASKIAVETTKYHTQIQRTHTMNMTQQKHSNKIDFTIFFLSHKTLMLSSLGSFQKWCAGLRCRQASRWILSFGNLRLVGAYSWDPMELGVAPMEVHTCEKKIHSTSDFLDIFLNGWWFWRGGFQIIHPLLSG